MLKAVILDFNGVILDDEPIHFKPEGCLVIEDSIGGVGGARAAGMRCLAVSNSYPDKKLKEANRVVHSLEEVQVDSLPSLFENPA
jgi:beta-phosphoglucomutase-like phosphatase (HAD superfamily)